MSQDITRPVVTAFASKISLSSKNAKSKAERAMLGFETISLAPIDQRLIERKLLDADEIAWLNGYHARVRKILSPMVDRQTRAWLKDVTRPLVKAAR